MSGNGTGVDRAAGSALALLGIATAIEGSTFEVAFMTDPVGPKALPYLVSTLLVVAGVTTALRPRSSIGLPTRAATARMGGAVAAFMLYALALPLLGFFTSTALVVTALSLLYRGPPLQSAVAAVALSGGLWLLFVRVLSLPLPIGDLWIR